MRFGRGRPGDRIQFLAAGRLAPFSGFEWPAPVGGAPGDWVGLLRFDPVEAAFTPAASSTCRSGSTASCGESNSAATSSTKRRSWSPGAAGCWIGSAPGRASPTSSSPSSMPAARASTPRGRRSTWRRSWSRRPGRWSTAAPRTPGTCRARSHVCRRRARLGRQAILAGNVDRRAARPVAFRRARRDSWVDDADALPRTDMPELVELVTDYLEGALDGDQRRRFDEHLAACPGCAATSTRSGDDPADGRLTERDSAPERVTRCSTPSAAGSVRASPERADRPAGLDVEVESRSRGRPRGRARRGCAPRRSRRPIGVCRDRPEAVGDRAERLAHEVRVGEAGGDRGQQDRPGIVLVDERAADLEERRVDRRRWCRPGRLPRNSSS